MTGPPHRFFVPELDTLWERIGEHQEPEVLHCEHVYLDTAHPSLFYTGFARARRVVEAGAELFAPGEGWHVECRPDAASPIVEHAQRAETLDEIVAMLADHMEIEDVRCCFGVRYERHRYLLRGIRIDIDYNVAYHSLLGYERFCVGKESVPRMTARASTKRKHNKALEALLAELPSAPQTSKKWMGFHFMKSCYELPRFDDLAGYEYELKLDGAPLDVHPGDLPYPVLEVHQSDSLRRYYKKYRACLRGDQAHLVEKGPVQVIGGILKRREQKRRGLDPWELPEPTMVMRRYKREVNVINPDTGRVYTLSLHHCDAGETFDQLEIEYDGRLVPGAVTEMARFRLDHDPRHFLNMATQADAQGWGTVGDTLRERYLAFLPDAPDAAVVRASMTGQEAPTGEIDVDPRIEAEVIADMQLLREMLVHRNTWRPSRTTKRKWLRGVYADGKS